MGLAELRREYIAYTSFLGSYIKRTSRSLGDHSLNVHLESTIIKVLNIAYELDLADVNKSVKNFKAIDAGDKQKKVCFQITSNSRFTKISDTLNKIVDDRQFEYYENVFFFYLESKPKLSDSNLDKIKDIVGKNFSFTKDNLIGFDNILEKVSAEYDKLSEIVGIMRKEINTFDLKFSAKEAISVGIVITSDLDKKGEKLLTDLCENFTRKGCNIVVNQEEFYANLKENEKVTLVSESNEIPHLMLCLIVIGRDTPNHKSCFILNHALNNETLIQNIAFNPIKEDVSHKLIKIKTHKVITEKRLEKQVNQILSSYYAKKENKRIENHDIDEIKNIFTQTFEYVNMAEGDKSSPYFNYMMFKSDYSTPMKFLVVRKKIDSFNAAATDFRSKFPNDTNFTLLVPKDNNHKTDFRLKNLANLFNVKLCKYTSDIISEPIKKGYNHITLFKQKTFINPILRDYNDPDNSDLGINEILEWFNKENSPLLFLIGPGGIGKTTLCQKLHDELAGSGEIVLYINATTFQNELNQNHFRNYNDSTYDLYDFYQRWFPATSTHSQLIQRSSFYANLNEGNIKIIFDGVDELIASGTGFDLLNFIKAIESITDISYLSKIIISVRDFHYKEASKRFDLVEDDNLPDHETLVIESFTHSMAKKYFEEELAGIETLIHGSMDILKEITDTNGKGFSPYLLFLISKIATEESTSDSELDIDGMPVVKHPLDIILREYLKREYMKKDPQGGVEISHQLEFLLALAYKYEGAFKVESAQKVFKSITGEEFNQIVFNKLKDHPYLFFSEDRQQFDFEIDNWRQHLRSIVLEKKIKENSLNNSDLELMAFYVQPQSSLFKLLLSRLKNEERRELISILRTELSDSVLEEEVQSYFISNVFNLQLSLVPKNSRNRKRFTALLKENFEIDSDVISGLSLIDLPSNSPVTFDFSNLAITESTIINYPRFFECKFNKDTFFFETCALKELGGREYVESQTTAKPSNFDEKLMGDGSHNLFLQHQNAEKFKDHGRLIFHSLKILLSKLILVSGGISKSNIKKHYLSNGKFSNEDFEILYDILREYGFLQIEDRSITLSSDKHMDVNMFVENSYLSGSIAQVFKSIKRKYTSSK